MKKVALAFSGGLDTTYCALYLKKQLGYEVHTVTIQTGGFSADEVAAIEKHALSLGVASHTLMDETEKYYQQVIRFLLFGNVLKNGTYPLSVSAERMSQALATAQFAQKIKAEAVAHGSTGAGNDQVRFDMMMHILNPSLTILTPIRDQRLSREAEIDFLKAHHVNMNFEKAAYSINKGLWGTSVGGKETLKSNGMLPEEAWPTQVTEKEPKQLVLEFKQGEPIALNGKKDSPVKIIQALQAMAGAFGIGRDIHVGDTIIGIKGRVGFEAAAPLILIKAHHALEKHVLTKWQLYWKDQVAQFYGNWLHEGQYLDPVMRDMEAMLMSSQAHVSGKVFVTLHPYRFQLTGIESTYDLMSDKFGKYGEMNNGWSGDDVKGFSKIFGNQAAIYHQVKQTAHD